MIVGRAYSSDGEEEAHFDASSFFISCGEEDLVALCDAGFTGPVALNAASASQNEDVLRLFEYCSLASHSSSMSILCSFDPDAALIWLEANRPLAAARLRRRPDVRAALDRRLARLETSVPEDEDTL